MKKLFTLAAATTLGLASLGANAQAITVDGQLTAAEISTTGYQLIGKYTNPRGFGDFGLLSLYAAADASKVYFFVGGTVQNDASSKNALQLFIDRPAVTGSTLGTNLPRPTGGTTSFKYMDAKMDFAPDIALGIKGNGTTNQFQTEAVAYTSGTAATDQVVGTTALANTGATTTLTATGSYAGLNGAVMAYLASSGGTIVTNPGYNASATAAAYGGAGSYGWEMSLDRTAMGLTTAGSVLQVFVLQNNNDGGFLSSDFIPQQTAGTTGAGTNLGGFYSAPTMMVDFTAIAGKQTASVQVNASSATILATKAADAAAVALNVYPNPVSEAASVTYRVTEAASPVNIVLTDLMGRTVRVVENSMKPVGSQSVVIKKNDLAAGTYLVRVQVGEKVSTSKISVL